jgi:hypothetical protein
VHQQRGAVVERMRERRGRLDQLDVEVERVEERGDGRKGVDRRANVMAEARERQLGGACAASDRVARLEDEDRAAGLGEGDRGGEAVRPRADDDGV